MYELFMEEAVGFATVLVVAVAVASAVGVLYACGLRFWEQASAPGGSALARAVSVACFAACIAIVLVALWLIIPAFHK